MHIYKPLVIMMLRILLFGWRGYCLVWNYANTSWHFKYAIEFCHSEIHSPHCRYIIEFSRNWNIQNLKKGWMTCLNKIQIFSARNTKVLWGRGKGQKRVLTFSILEQLYSSSSTLERLYLHMVDFDSYIYYTKSYRYYAWNYCQLL